MKTVIILVTMWGIVHGEIHELWHFQKPVSLDICLKMNQLFTGGGRIAVATVRCDEWDDVMPSPLAFEGRLKVL